MCYGAETAWISAALAAAGAATSGYAQSQQLKKQDEVAAQGIIKQGQIGQQAQADVGKNIKSASQSNADASAKQAQQLSQFRSALQQGQNVSNSAAPSVPGASKAFTAAQGRAGTSANDYVQALANSAATTQGTQLERVGENEQLGDTASKLGLLSSQSQQEQALTKLKVQSTQANPWLKSLGLLLSAAGAAGGLSSAAGAGSGAASAATGAAGTAGTTAAGFTNGAGFLTDAGAGASGAGAALSGLAGAAPAAGSFGASALGGLSRAYGLYDKLYGTKNDQSTSTGF